MAKKVSDSQVAGIKAHAKAKNKETINKVNKAIDKLKRKNKPIYILLVGMFLGVKLATYTVEYAIYKSKFIGNKER